MRANGWLFVGAFGVALVVNPYLGCSSQPRSDFTYSEDEMKLAVLGSWVGSARIEGETVPFSLTLEQGRQSTKAPGVAPQCASRSFVKPAGACFVLSRMPVVGVLTSEHPGFNGVVDGDFVAYHTLDVVELSLHVETGAVLSGTLEDDAVTSGRVEGPLQGQFSVQRP